MRFTVDREALTAAVKFVTRVIPKSTVNSSETYLTMEAGAELVLRCKGGDEVLQCRIPLREVERAGRACVLGVLFSDMAGELYSAGANDVTVHVADGKMLVRCGKAKYQVMLFPEDCACQVPECDGTPVQIEVRGDALRGLVKRVEKTPSNAPGATEYLLLAYEEGRLKAVATDGARLVIADCEASRQGKANLWVCVSDVALQEIVRVAKDDALVTLRADKAVVQFTCGNVDVYSRALSRTFPDYSNIIRFGEQAVRTAVNTEALINALLGVAPLAKESKGRITLMFRAESILVKAVSVTYGEATRLVDAACTLKDGLEWVELDFNMGYLLDYLRGAGTETVHFGATREKPADIRLPDGAAGFLGVVMPITRYGQSAKSQEGVRAQDTDVVPA